jgi:polysaccharide export outer membrane protein
VSWFRTSTRRFLDAQTADAAPPGSALVIASAGFGSPPISCLAVIKPFRSWTNPKTSRQSARRFPPGTSLRSLASLGLLLAGFLIIPLANLYAQQPAQPQTDTVTALNADVKVPVENSDAEHPVPIERNPRYRLNRSDVLSLSFSLSPEFNQTVTVQPDGFITLQGVGSINVLGLTLPEAVTAIKNVYSKILRDPIIDVDLTDFQKAYFVVTGQVGKPGQYDLRYDLTVSEAIAVAGGLLPTAKTQVFLYRRGHTGWVEAKELKLKDFLHGKNVAEDAEMRPGDMIFVPEKTITKIRKYIPYSVGVPLSTTPSVY